jgi:ribonucleoside-diphosphate reductase alpha subunit
MKVIKRNGCYEDVSFDKILRRIQLLCIGDEFSYKLGIDPTIIAQKVCSEIYDGIETSHLDELSSQISISMYSVHPDFSKLASRIIISNHQKKTSDDFINVISELYRNNIIQKYLYDFVNQNSDQILHKIDHILDFKLDYFGFKTLEKSYLLKINGDIVERPQYLFMRVALCIHRMDIEKAFETYDHISNKQFIHATPTLFNAGTIREQLSSCFLLSMKDDSVTGIYDTLKDCALISQHAGGIGLHIHNIRANGSYIRGTNGTSNGIVPMLRVFNDTARYIDQGGGKRNGSFAIYLEPWHADILDFLELKKNHGNELERARDLFYGLWIPDLFMKKVETNEDWCLFCPNECLGLSDVYGDEFEELYHRYEREGKYSQKIKSQTLWFSILSSQIETGTPYLLYKDSCNRKSNQNNVGTIKSSNLCTEIIEYSDKDETAVCNLASISLPACIDYKDYQTYKFKIYSKKICDQCNYSKQYLQRYNISYEEVLLDDKKERLKLYQRIDEEEDIVVDSMPQIYDIDKKQYIGGFEELMKYLQPTINYHKIKDLSKIVTKNLNNIIDYNYYPIPETKRSNQRHRPIGIGVQGLANVFYEMKVSFDSKEAKEMNQQIFESIYYGALESSMELAKERQEIIFILQNMIQLNEKFNDDDIQLYKQIHNIMDDELNRTEYYGTYSTYIDSPMYHGKLQFDLWDHKVNDSLFNWTQLRHEIKQYGVRNSLLVAPMPTASTSQILGNFECFEPIMSNIYSRRVLAGEYTVINEYLVNDLLMIGLWDESMKHKIIEQDGSIQNIKEIPLFIRKIYKTVWEIKQKNILDMASDRGKFICQSQSLNLFIESPNYKVLSSMHFYGWKLGLKTGMYYLRTRPSSKPLQFTINPETTCESCSG